MSDFQSGLPIRVHDEDNIPYSQSNPMPVSIEESEGEELHIPNEAVDVVKDGGTANHDYVVTPGKTLQTTAVDYAGSGRMRAEVLVETAVASGVFTSKMVKFTSTSRPSGKMIFEPALKVGAGITIRVKVDNLDNQDQSLYSTIQGVEK
jgi:hypothetical protein